jgi:excinuclease ABC subunit C
MTIKDVEKINLPDSPGVYFFKKRRRILYIGKATSIRDRVKSYFSGDIIASRGQLILKMLSEANTVDTIQTDSVLEALILEAYLIKKHLPTYNTEGKDDKSFNYVVITEEDFPRVLVVRGKELQTTNLKLKANYGPFPHGGMFKSAMKIIRRIFPFRDKCIINIGKPCFNHQIGLCPGVCSGEITKEEYARTIRNLRLFFEGKKSSLIKRLESDMKKYARKLEFEKAEKIKRTIFGIQHIQDVSLIKREVLQREKNTPSFRIEAYDIAHISGTNAVGVMTAVENGEVKKSDYRKFRIRGDKKRSDTDTLKEVLRRRFNHDEWPLPKLIAVDGGKAQIKAGMIVLNEYGFKIPIVSVVKDERHKPKNILGDKQFRTKYGKDILLANSEAHRFAVSYHRKLREKVA